MGIASPRPSLAFRDAEYDTDPGVMMTRRRLATGAVNMQKASGRTDDQRETVGFDGLTLAHEMCGKLSKEGENADPTAGRGG